VSGVDGNTEKCVVFIITFSYISTKKSLFGGMFLFSVSYNDFMKSFTPYKRISGIRGIMGLSVYS
jgi:hypothetical protein